MRGKKNDIVLREKNSVRRAEGQCNGERRKGCEVTGREKRTRGPSGKCKAWGKKIGRELRVDGPEFIAREGIVGWKKSLKKKRGFQRGSHLEKKHGKRKN